MTTAEQTRELDFLQKKIALKTVEIEKQTVELEKLKAIEEIIRTYIPSDAGIRHFKSKSLFAQLGEILNPANCKI